MRIYCVHYRARQGQYLVNLERGKDNLAEYLTKNHPIPTPTQVSTPSIRYIETWEGVLPPPLLRKCTMGGKKSPFPTNRLLIDGDGQATRYRRRMRK